MRLSVRRSIRRPWSSRGLVAVWVVTFAIAAAAHAGEAAPAGADESWRRGEGWGVAVLGGLGWGAIRYEVESQLGARTATDEAVSAFGQYFFDVRALSPRLGDAAWSPRLFLKGGYTGRLGTGSEDLLEGNRWTFAEGEAEFRSRWTVALGASFPVETQRGRTLLHVNPSLGYGREKSRVESVVVDAAGRPLLSTTEDLEANEIVPGLELSFPMLRLGERGRLDLAVGADFPIAVGSTTSRSMLVAPGAPGPVSVEFERRPVGYDAYAGVRLVFDVL